MRLACALLALLAGCGHEHLNFSLPDAGRSSGNNRAPRDAIGAGGLCDSPADCSASGDSRSQNRSPVGQNGQLQSDAGASKANGSSGARSGSSDSAMGTGLGSPSGGAQQGSSDDRFSDDPNGYPTAPGEEPPWCQQGKAFDEICANGVDDDCDGTVDEFPGLRQPCSNQCGGGVYVCNRTTHTMVCNGCVGVQARFGDSHACGDGVVDAGEECDPAAPDEHRDITCTSDCRRPLFIRCVEGGLADPSLCDSLHRCDPRVGACVPVLGPGQPRCPKIPIEGSGGSAFYPMLETEGAECWITCTKSEQCPSVLSDCYMAFCVVPM